MTPPDNQQSVRSGWATARLASLRAVPRHVKTVLIVSFLSSLGAGLYVTGSSVYFVRSVGLSPVQVGFGLSAAALLGVTAGIPIGRLADSRGARNVTVTLLVFAIPVLIALTQVRSFWSFLPAAAVFGVLLMGSDVGLSALMAELVGSAGAARLAVYARSAFNVGFSVGLLGAGVIIAIGTRSAYLFLFTGDGITIALTCCLMLVRFPPTRSEPAQDTGKPRQSALRDLPYLLVAQISGLTRLGDTILTVGIPLWIVTRTTAPRALAAWLLVANTLLVAALQARVTRHVDNPQGAARIQRWGFIALMLACLVISPSAHLVAWLAVTTLLAGTVALTFGEMWGEGAWWFLRYSLAPQTAQGAYGGVFALGQAIPGVIGPVLVTALGVDLGAAGWIMLAVIFLLCAVLGQWPVRWAEARRAASQALD